MTACACACACACVCPATQGTPVHHPSCPERARLRVNPTRADWFDVGTLRPRSDEDGESNEGLADWESARIYGGRDVD